VAGSNPQGKKSKKGTWSSEERKMKIPIKKKKKREDGEDLYIKDKG